MTAAEQDDCYGALKLARRIIRHEDSVIGRAVVTPVLTMQAAE
jgi:flagellar protein FlbT